jgi:PAS domain S-box-containing protein
MTPDHPAKQPAPPAPAPPNLVSVRGTELLTTDTRDQYRQKLARITLDSMVQFVGLLDAHGTVLEINQVALDGGGLQLSDVEGKPFWTTFWWQVSADINRVLQESIRRASRGEFVRWDTEIYGRSGGKETIVIDASLCPVKDEQGNVVFITAEGRDITEKKAQEREIAQKNEELQALLLRIKELDEIKNQFFANVSHELRTPLALILGPAERLLDRNRVMSPNERLESSQIIARNARLLLKHVNDLLDISKLEAGKLRIDLQDLDVAALVRFTASHFDLLAHSKGIRFQLDVPDQLLSAVDPAKFQRVLMNLLSNAFKFTPAEGQIRCAVRVDDDEDRLLVSVDDSGPGIKPELRQAVFDRFRQGDGGSDRRFGGTGLGLAIAKEFVELHRGQIRISDSDLGGACFQVSLQHGPLTAGATTERPVPASALEPEMIQGFIDELHTGAPTRAEQPGAGAGAGASAGSAPAARTRVLVVEDHPDMNRFIAESLSDIYDVSTAFDGREGLAMATALHPALIVSDIMMPRMSGAEMIAEVRKQPELAHTPILLLSAKADDELKNRLLANGANDFVAKPFSEPDLIARVANLIRARQATLDAVLARQELQDFFMQAVLPMVILAGPDHRFTLANPPYERFVGRKVVGRTLREAFTPDEIGHFLPILDRVYQTGEPFIGKEMRLYLPDAEGIAQSHWINLSYCPFRDAEGTIRGVMAIVLDVTAEVQARKKVEETITELKQERDLRERFVAALTHDLRTPLNAARMGAEILMRKMQDSEAVTTLSKRVVSNIDRADGMIRDLLDASRIKAGQGIPIAVRECRLDEVVGLAVKGIQEVQGPRLRIRNDAGAISGYWDDKSLHRVIENLAGNALKYGSHHTPVTIGLIQTDEWVEIDVHNEGNPIALEDQKALFELYRRPTSAAARDQTGWGIGLTWSRASSKPTPAPCASRATSSREPRSSSACPSTAARAHHRREPPDHDRDP